MRIKINTSDGSFLNADWDTDLGKFEALSQIGEMLGSGGSMVFGNCVISGRHIISVEAVNA